jgi:hypothetical protein
MSAIKITAEFNNTLFSFIAAGKEPWVIICEDFAVGAYANRAAARTAKQAENLVGSIKKASEVEFEVIKPLVEEKPIIGEFTHCPSCGIHLSNGVGVHNQEVNGELVKHEAFEYACLACGHEFGPAIMIEVKHTSTIDSPCAFVHEMAAKMHAANPDVRRKDVVAACIAAGVNRSTARTQYQIWFANNC